MSHLLIVDDEPDLILAQMHHVFGAAQYRIDAARTGEEAIRRVADRAPDVVLLDLHLPDLSGLEVYSVSSRLTPEFRSCSSRVPPRRIMPSTR